MILNDKQIVQITGGVYDVKPDISVFSYEVFIDSRKVSNNSVFAALCGEKADGYIFIDSALQRGASIILCDKPVSKQTRVIAKEFGAAIIVVDDVVKAIQKIASFWRKKLKCKVIGITGSSGKSTTKNLINDVLSTKFKVTATYKNFNNQLGLPLTICKSNINDEALILEMGMRGLDQINELCKIANPDMGLITNIGESHIELLGSMENIANAKCELAQNIPDNSGIVFLNICDEFTDYIIERANLISRGICIVLYGADRFNNTYESYPQVWAEDIKKNEIGSYGFSMHAKGFDKFNANNMELQVSSCRLKLTGKHNIYNALAAAGVGCVYGLSLYDCTHAINQSIAHAGRFKILPCKAGYSIIDDSYNANPSSMQASLKAFKDMKKDMRHIAILGDMEELGIYSDKYHEKIGELVYKLGIDLLICVGKKAKILGDSALKRGYCDEQVIFCDDAKRALVAIENNVVSGDLLLIKASNAIGLDYLVKALKD